MPQINPAQDSGVNLDNVETVFIDTADLSELPSHLMHPRDLETFVGLNINASELKALQVSSNSHGIEAAGMLISDDGTIENMVEIENEDSEMDTSDPHQHSPQGMDVEENDMMNSIDLLHDGQEFLPITGTEEMLDPSQDESSQKSLLCSSSSSSLNREDSGISSEDGSQHLTGLESLGTQILKTSSGQFVILQPNQTSISLGALGGKIITSGGQIFSTLSTLGSGNNKPIFVNASQHNSGVRQITNLNQTQPKFRTVQLKQPMLLSQAQNAGPVTKVILPSQPGVSLSQQLRMMTSQTSGSNSSPSKMTLQFQPVGLTLSSKNMQSPTKPIVNDGKSTTKLKIPLNFPFKTATTTIPITQFTTVLNDDNNETLKNAENLSSSMASTISSPQKIIIKGKLPFNSVNSFPTSFKPGQILTSNQGTQLIKIPVSQLSQLTSQGQTIQVGNKMNFRLVTTNSSSLATSDTVNSNQTVYKTLNIAKAIAPNNNNNNTKPKSVPVSPQTLTINHQGKQQRLIIPVSNQNAISLSNSNVSGSVHIRPQGSITLPASALPPGVLSNAQPGSLVMIPAQYFQNASNLNSQIIQVSNQISQVASIPSMPVKNSTPKTLIDANGIKPRKPCNCTKSQCLKLYCDCFANGEFCNNCNCANCYNNLTHEEERQKAIKSCLERNPQAFRPKIGKGGNDDERRHNKGCNCKRSGCLKNYCECFEAKIPCSNMCKCCGCRNIDSGQPFERKKYLQLAEIAESRGNKPIAMKCRPISLASFPSPAKMSFSASSRGLYCRINQEVVEATCQCLLAQAEKSEKALMSDAEIELKVINEFSRCLLQIIGISSKGRGPAD